MSRSALTALVVLVVALLACAEQPQQPPQTPEQRMGAAIGAVGAGIERGMRTEPEPQGAVYCRTRGECPSGFDCVKRAGASTGICIE